MTTTVNYWLTIAAAAFEQKLARSLYWWLLLVVLLFVRFSTAQDEYFTDSDGVLMAQCDYDSIDRLHNELDIHIQPNDVMAGPYDFSDPDDYLCARDCNRYPDSRLCYYRWTIEQYHVMGPACNGCPNNQTACFNPQCVTADGVERAFISINRQLPGPAIMVCKDDTVIVDVRSKLMDHEGSIHWHGQHQKADDSSGSTPYMDGVPHLTQCPIVIGSVFRYNFTAHNIGTQYYYSGASLQHSDGFKGAFIVRAIDSLELNRHAYNADLFSHVIIIQDWLHDLTITRYPGYTNASSIPDLTGLKAVSYLINGKGNYKDPTTSTKTPLSVFYVKSGLKYRFRIVGATSYHGLVVITFENHNLTLIAVDNDAVQPTACGSIAVSPGDRYDVVLTANQPAGSYWIRVTGVDGASSAYSQLAVIQYSNAQNHTNYIPTLPITNSSALQFAYPIINDVRNGCDINDRSVICIRDLNSKTNCSSRILNQQPDYRLFVRTGAHQFSNSELFQSKLFKYFFKPSSDQLIGYTYNNVRNVMPSFPLLTEDLPIPNDIVCYANQNNSANLTECFNLVYCPFNKSLEIVFIDVQCQTQRFCSLECANKFACDISNGTSISHHIHGYSWYVMNQAGPPSVGDANATAAALNNTRSPPLKDTITVPAGGCATVRLITDNPGLWLLTSQVASHFGMQMVIQIGDRGQFNQPPNSFPNCADFIQTL